MNLILQRLNCRPDGVFGTLLDEEGTQIAVTLEHSYDCVPKIPNGTYLCVRGPHRLHGMDHDFETFEITGVEGHSNLLFHAGNFNKDSEGCVLLGESLAEVGISEMITNSKATFERFLTHVGNEAQFALTVI